jgi:endonuclease YncB( thermonuclease family)
MKPSFHVIAALLATLTATPIQAQSVVMGLGRAEDGDTLMVGETKVRLFGIDAPEFDQTCKRNGTQWSCGTDAAEALMRLVTGKDVQCVSTGKDQYGRILGSCSVGGTDVNRTMVALGYAVAYRRYSSDYVSAEQSAKAGKLGLWAGTFEIPEQYRRTGGVSAEPRVRSSHGAPGASSNNWAQRARANCNIKGNRNRKGQWIYHLPGMPYYDQTRAEEIFCAEAEAQAAGYRRAIVR